MSASTRQDPDEEDGRNWRRYLLLLLLLLIAVIAGSGLTAFIGDIGPADENQTRVDLTPTGPDGDIVVTDTATPGDREPTGTPEPPETPTERATATPDRVSTAGGGGGGGQSGGSVALRAVGSGVLFQYDGVAPGDSGREHLVLRNAGTQPGELVVADVRVEDFENGIVGPEAGVDTSPNAGELSEAVEVVVSVRYPDGTTEYLYGTGQGAKPLAAIADADPADGEQLGPGTEAEVVVDWQVPASTGNEIQSDALTVDVRFQLRARN
ncbi:hypothetical protein [Halorientalis litorea]|uniref:hypothetical protein n=1 Tax=Halorientalis litorea TaxID=2931977 RepID=UPI001FF3B4DD|nr:hypothetical protein [Halorientalis litorea]